MRGWTQMRRVMLAVLVTAGALAIAGPAREAVAAPPGSTMVTPMPSPGAGGTSGTSGAPGMINPANRMPSNAAHAGAPSQEQADGFAALVDLSPLARVAVFDRGRVVSFDSFTSSMMRFVSGPKRIDGNPPSFTYLDMMLRPERYADRPVIYVGKKLVRAELVRVLEAAGREQLDQIRMDPRRALTPEQEARFEAGIRERLDRFMEYGVISPVLMRDPAVADLLEQMSRDLLRTAKPVQAIRGAMNLLDPGRLRSRLMLLPPPSGEYHDRWHTLDELTVAAIDDPEYSMIDPALRADLAVVWRSFTSAWGRSDAAGVNDSAARLADLLLMVNTDRAIYPSSTRLELESWYFGSRHMTWVWIFYAFSLVPLTLFAVFRWPGAFWTGMAMFGVAFLLHTAAFIIRWYVSGRFPNSNMFEAVTTAAWFGSLFAVPVELWLRRLPFRGLFALTAGTASMVALMAAYYLPLSLDPHISNRMPVLLDLWLYIHTNVIIFAYALVFMASVTGVLYLGYRLVRWLQGAHGDWWKTEYARVGGAASLIMTNPDGTTYIERPRTTLGQVFDGTTMILVELSFILLWAGLVMGAIWADHSWGRPWGWDPKEVFALNTFLVFAVLIHVRMKARDKGLWTAIIAIVGCAVMVFNWVVINFTIAGLHSYA